MLNLPENLQQLEESMCALESRYAAVLDGVEPSQVDAARNLLHYLALRSIDIRGMQDALHAEGLSSLASAESHIRSQVQAVRKRLGHGYAPAAQEVGTIAASQQHLSDNSLALFGSVGTAIMVTFDDEFAHDSVLLKKLLQQGMQVARINCAHHNADAWLQMITQLKKACKATGLPCKIYMDLAGPKIRTRLINKGLEKGKANVAAGDTIYLAESNKGFDEDAVVVHPNLPGIVAGLKEGERVFFDDGAIAGLVQRKGKSYVVVRVEHVAGANVQLKNDKGINFPDSDLAVDSLTPFDVECLPFVCQHADMVGYSFVRQPGDVARLQAILAQVSAKPPHLVLKIETPEAVKQLPNLLLAGMQRRHFGVMIARGDLAVEIGFERMSEIQDEILWICEAAHAPVIWATQVLESLQKKGLATRAEITDAAKAATAECVMINKGSHTVEVVKALRDIIQRTDGHRHKKRFTLRALSIAQQFLQNNPG
jgi:pyruvate kinase